MGAAVLRPALTGHKTGPLRVEIRVGPNASRGEVGGNHGRWVVKSRSSVSEPDAVASFYGADRGLICSSCP